MIELALRNFQSLPLGGLTASAPPPLEPWLLGTLIFHVESITNYSAGAIMHRDLCKSYVGRIGTVITWS